MLKPALARKRKSGPYVNLLIRTLLRTLAWRLIRAARSAYDTAFGQVRLIAAGAASKGAGRVEVAARSVC
jgi:hypothetical protein